MGGFYKLRTPCTEEANKPVYDQKFFLALAREGNVAWKRWQDANRYTARVTFEGVDFNKPENDFINLAAFDLPDRVNFRACKFGANTFAKYIDAWKSRVERTVELKGWTIFRDAVDLSSATFGRGVDLCGATFGHDVNLSGATFGDGAKLTGVTFGQKANLSGVTFGELAHLNGVTFGNLANLSGATFGDRADLSCTTFRNFADLSDATFGDWADLSGVTFGRASYLSGAKFKGTVNLRAISKEKWRQNISKILTWSNSIPQVADIIPGWPEERKQEFLAVREAASELGGGPDTFGDIYFTRACFVGTADFSGRSFSDGCNLTGTHFSQPPKFDDCNNVGDIDLYGTRIGFSGLFEGMGRKVKVSGWTTDSNVAIRLRALRNLADKTKNHDLERDLYIEERKAERGIVLANYWQEGWTVLVKPRFLSHCLWIAIMGGYWLLADYGRSFLRPILALAASVFLFQAAYFVVLPKPSAPGARDFNDAVWTFAVANALPFVGALTLEKEVKTTLVCGGRPTDSANAQSSSICAPVPLPSFSFQLIILGQSIFSVICVFLAALALRNFFKLR